jgi:hypothetical protein
VDREGGFASTRHKETSSEKVSLYLVSAEWLCTLSITQGAMLFRSSISPNKKYHYDQNNLKDWKYLDLSNT